MRMLGENATESDRPQLADLIGKLSVMIRNWSGQAVDGTGIVQAFNTGGSRPPLCWVFNDAGELNALMGCVGHDQPVVAMRSLHKIFSAASTGRNAAIDMIGTYYAGALLYRPWTNGCIIGGNCQASDIAYRIAAKLISRNVGVRRFVTLDADLNVPLPVPVRVIFGRESHLNPKNIAGPKTYSPEDDPRRLLFPQREFVETPGTHSHYFDTENVEALAANILRDQRRGAAPAERAATDWKCERIDAKTLSLVAKAPVLVPPAPMGVSPVFHDAGGDLLTRRTSDSLIAPVTVKDGQIFARIQLPDLPENQTLRPILCAEGAGPLTWPLDRQPSFRL